jgi:NAD(P)-dependent dehydrogenase (short-subunit alcohol dehydrogenase family)
MSGTITNRGMHTPAYNSSKSAVLQLGRSLAVEFGPDRVRVNTLSPGYIMTAMTAGLLEKDPALAKQWTNDNPLARLSYPWEFKGPAVFLASDASSFMTGSDLLVDGGHWCGPDLAGFKRVGLVLTPITGLFSSAW